MKHFSLFVKNLILIERPTTISDPMFTYVWQAKYIIFVIPFPFHYCPGVLGELYHWMLGSRLFKYISLAFSSYVYVFLEWCVLDKTDSHITARRQEELLLMTFIKRGGLPWVSVDTIPDRTETTNIVTIKRNQSWPPQCSPWSSDKSSPCRLGNWSGCTATSGVASWPIRKTTLQPTWPLTRVQTAL